LILRYRSSALLASFLYPEMNLKYTIGIATGVPVTFISAGETGPDGLDGFL
jgi:hypothetical protein